jgi:hypothetical protein
MSDEYCPSLNDGFLANAIINNKKKGDALGGECEIVGLIVKGYFQAHDNVIRDDAIKALNRYMQFLVFFRNKYPYMSFGESENQTTRVWIESELFKLQNHSGDWKDFWRFILKWKVG